MPQRLWRRIMARLGPGVPRGAIRDAEALGRAVHGTAALVAQTVLYGYLKARMGTQFRTWFEDERYAHEITQARARLHVACVADLAAHLARLLCVDPGARQALARHLCDLAMAEAQSESDLPALDLDPHAALGALDWSRPADSDADFKASCSAAASVAPVSAQFRAEDADMLRSTTRYRWIEPRRKLLARIDKDARFSGFQASRDHTSH